MVHPQFSVRAWLQFYVVVAAVSVVVVIAVVVAGGGDAGVSVMTS